MAASHKPYNNNNNNNKKKISRPQISQPVKSTMIDANRTLTLHGC